MVNRRYLDMDSQNFKTAIFFAMLAVLTLVALALCFTFDIAGIWGFVCGVFILIFGLGAGAEFIASVTVLALSDANDPQEQAPAGPGLLDAPGATASADGGGRLAPEDVRARFDLYTFVAGICDGVVGEETWYKRGLSKGDYRFLIKYLAQLGIVFTRDGAQPKALVPLPTAMRAIATDKGDKDFWAEVREIYPMVHSQGQLIDDPDPVERSGTPSPLPEEDDED